jgi:hypothetical protein
MWNGRPDWADIISEHTKARRMKALPAMLAAMEFWIKWYDANGGYPDKARCDWERAHYRFYQRLINEKPSAYVAGPIDARTDLASQLRGRWDAAIGPVVIWTEPDQSPADARAMPAQIIAFPRKPQIETPQRVRGVWAGTYAEYTAHPEFHRIAAEAKKQWAAVRPEWAYRCLLNVKHTGPIEMHHGSYRGVPFGEHWTELIPLCEECHGRFHYRMQPPAGLFDELRDERKAA